MHEKVSEQVVPPYTKSLYPPACHPWCALSHAYTAVPYGRGIVCEVILAMLFLPTPHVVLKKKVHVPISLHRWLLDNCLSPPVLGFCQSFGLDTDVRRRSRHSECRECPLGSGDLSRVAVGPCVGKTCRFWKHEIRCKTPPCTGWCQCKAVHGSKSARIGMGIWANFKACLMKATLILPVFSEHAAKRFCWRRTQPFWGCLEQSQRYERYHWPRTVRIETAEKLMRHPLKLGQEKTLQTWVEQKKGTFGISWRGNLRKR